MLASKEKWWIFSKDGWIKDLICHNYKVILRNRWYNILSVLFKFCQRDIMHNTVIKCRKITSYYITVISNVFNQASKNIYTNYGKCTDLQTYFSEKNIWLSSQVFWRIAVSKFQGNRYVLNNVIGCGYLTAICYGNIPVFHIQ